MKANELRINNFLQLGNSQIQVHTINFELRPGYLINKIEVAEFSGTPLTEEWLLKFGFSKSDTYFHLDYGIIVYWSEAVGFHKVIDGVIFKFPYVHTLQNFMALTGEELSIVDMSADEVI